MMPVLDKLSNVHDVEFVGSRYDIGGIPGWLQASIQMVINHNGSKINSTVKNFI